MTIMTALVDHDCRMPHDLLRDLAEMLTLELGDGSEFSRPDPYGYGIPMIFRVAQNLKDVAPGEQIMGFWSKPDVPGALGYHDRGPLGQQISHIFPLLLDALEDSSVTCGHEAVEAGADADCQTVVIGPDNVARCREPGDPVESFSFAAKPCASGRVLQMTDWVRPAHFCPPDDWGKAFTDVMGLTSQCGEILDGGYQLIWTSKGWQQEQRGEKSAYRKAVEAAGMGRLNKYKSKSAEQIKFQKI